MPKIHSFLQSTHFQTTVILSRPCSSSLIQDLKEEYLDTPVEVSGGSRAQQIMSKVQKEKEEYEEAYLIRLPVSKTEKHRQRRLTTLGECADCDT